MWKIPFAGFILYKSRLWQTCIDLFSHKHKLQHKRNTDNYLQRKVNNIQRIRLSYCAQFWFCFEYFFSKCLIIIIYRFVYFDRYHESIRKKNSHPKGGKHSILNQYSDKASTSTKMGIKDLDALSKTIKRKSKKILINKKYRVTPKRFTFGTECWKVI